MGIKLDNTVNAGAIIQVVAMLVTAVGAIVWIKADIRQLADLQIRIEAQTAAEIASIKADALSRESRLRSAELSIAGQTSDLRSINASLVRIERLLESSNSSP